MAAVQLGVFVTPDAAGRDDVLAWVELVLWPAEGSSVELERFAGEVAPALRRELA